MIRSGWSGAGTAGLMMCALALAGCGDEGPVAPERTPAPEAALRAAPADRYIVLMKEGRAGGLGARGLSTDLARVGGRVERLHAEIGVLQARLTASAAADLIRQPDVEAVVKDRMVQWLPPSERGARGLQALPARQSNQRTAAFFDEQWNIRRIKAPQAWNASNQGRGVTVCILDTGVDPRHIDMAGKLDLSLSTSFVATERADRDFDLHGTAMASIVTTNGIGIASVAPDTRVCSVKVLDRTGSGTFGDVTAGIMYVGTAGAIDGGARVSVANMSLGALLPANDPDVKALARAMQRAVNFSTKRGVLFVASAGNEASNLNDPSLIHLPSSLDNVLSVGATGPIGQKRFDHLASYSNVGRAGVDVFAPGGEFVFPQNVLDDLILAACSSSTRAPGFEDCAGGRSFLFLAGTSPAAAHVSGEAAVIQAELPGVQTPAQLTACILQTADPLPRPSLSASGRINVFAGQACH